MGGEGGGDVQTSSIFPAAAILAKTYRTISHISTKKQHFNLRPSPTSLPLTMMVSGVKNLPPIVYSQESTFFKSAGKDLCKAITSFSQLPIKTVKTKGSVPNPFLPDCSFEQKSI